MLGRGMLAVPAPGESSSILQVGARGAIHLHQGTKNGPGKLPRLPLSEALLDTGV